MFGFLIQEQNDNKSSSISNRRNLIYSRYATNSRKATTARNQQQQRCQQQQETPVTEETSNSCREDSNSRDSSNRRDSRDQTTAVRVQQRQACSCTRNNFNIRGCQQ
jgi:hypothetical protein